MHGRKKGGVTGFPFRRRKNPRITMVKGKQTVTSPSFPSKKQVKSMTSKLSKAKKSKSAMQKKIIKAPIGQKSFLKKKYDAKIAKQAKEAELLEKKLKKAEASRREAIKEVSALKKAGFKPKKKKSKKSKKEKAMAKKKKKGGKKKASKKKVAKKKVAKKRGRKKVAKKAANPIRRRRKKSHKKARKSRKKYRRNPIFKGDIMKKYLGVDLKEAGGLVIGGAIFNTVNGLAAKIPGVSTVQGMLAGVPVVGTAAMPLLLGALAKFFGEKQKIKALEVVGEGLVAASLVNMGVSASSMIPGLSGMGALMIGPRGEMDLGRYPHLVSKPANFGGAFDQLGDMNIYPRDEVSALGEMAEVQLG